MLSSENREVGSGAAPRTPDPDSGLPVGGRARSLRAALEVVREEGIDKLTTRAIARRSGLTQPAVYRHFPNMEALVGEVMGVLRAGFLERLQRSLEAGSAEGRLRAALGSFRDLAVEEPFHFDALFLTPPAEPAPAREGSERRPTIFQFLVERVAECSAAGVLRRGGPVTMALSLAAHAQGVALMYRRGRFGSESRFREFFDASLEDLLRGLK